MSARKCQPEEAVRLYVEEGFPLSRIASLYGCSKEAVRQVLIRRGVPLRGRGGNQHGGSRH
jgi:predicted HTH domain antitoxin